MSYGFANKQGAASAGAESTDMPILCESCLGPNPYVRMTRIPYGGECKVCTRPFTVFRWSPSAGARPKQTSICSTCAKMKNVCQTCVLDLQYHVSVQARDAAMGLKNAVPTTDINRQYFVNNVEAQGDTGAASSSAGPSSRAGQDLLKKLTRAEPSYKTKRPVPCAFFAKGNCPRGDECPFQHELPPSMTTSEPKSSSPSPAAPTESATTSHQVLASRAPGGTPLTPPEDQSIVTLFFSNLPEFAAAYDGHLRRLFAPSPSSSSSSDEETIISTVTLVPKTKCAFVNFVNREHAERAAAKCATKMELKGHPIRVSWGRPRPSANASRPSEASGPANAEGGSAATATT